MKKILLLATCVATMTIASAQTSGYNMIVKLTNGSTYTVPADSVDEVTFQPVSGEDEVFNILDEEHIPNAKFRQYVYENIANHQDVFTNVQAAAYTGELNLVGCDLANSQGLEYFKNITTLIIRSNQSLAELDLSEFTNLRKLDTYNCWALKDLKLCPDAPLEYLDISVTILYKYNITPFKNTLKYINLGGLKYTNSDLNLHDFMVADTIKVPNNAFTSADLSNMTNLKYIELYQNKLTSVNVSGCTNLGALYLHYNSLSSIDITDCTNMQYIAVSSNPAISEIDLSNQKASLVQVLIDNTKISSIDVKGCVNLEFLQCGYTSITEAPDLSDCTKLQYVRFEHTAIDSLDLTNNKALVEIACYNTNLHWLTCEDMPNLEMINAFDNKQMQGFTMRNLPALSQLSAYRNTVMGPRVDISQGLNHNATFYLHENPNLHEIKVWEGFNDNQTWYDDGVSIVTE